MPVSAPANTDSPVGERLVKPLIYASFWGRLWRDDAAHKARAAQIGGALARLSGILDVGPFMQASFYINEDWYARETPVGLSPEFVAAMLQRVINRGVAPESNGRDDGSTAIVLVFPGDDLAGAGRGQAPMAAYHGHFVTLTGNTCWFAVVPSSGAGGAASTGPGGAAFLADVVEAICANPMPADGCSLISPKAAVEPRAEEDTESAPEQPARGLLPLPSLHMTEFVHGFTVNEDELRRYLAKLASPLNFDEITGGADILERAAALSKAMFRERATRPRPATPVELRDFTRPNPRITIPERFSALRSMIGESHPDVDLVADILNGVSEEDFSRLRKVHFGRGETKYIDAVFWTYQKLREARRLGLDAGAPLNIWDIGCAGGYFSKVCEHFGHTVVGTDVNNTVYEEIAKALNVYRIIDVISPSTKTTDFQMKFDLITCSQVEFNYKIPRTHPPINWELAEWMFLLQDFIDKQLRFPGRIYLALNCQRRSGEGVFNPELLEFCRDKGALVNAARGIIDWRLAERISF